MYCCPPGFSLHGISQARILESVAISFSRGSSSPRNRTWVSSVAGRFSTNWARREGRSPAVENGKPLSILAWKIPWTEKPGGLQSKGWKRVRRDWAIELEHSTTFKLTMWVPAITFQSCLTLCNPVDFSQPGSSDHGILQARILGWVAIPFFRRSSWPRDQTHVSCGFRATSRFFTTEPPGKPLSRLYQPIKNKQLNTILPLNTLFTLEFLRPQFKNSLNRYQAQVWGWT